MTVSSIVFFVVFAISMPISFYVLRASRLEECFKQGRINEIRIAYCILILIISFLLASAFSGLTSLF